MTETTRVNESTGSMAVLYVAFELGSKSWTMASTAGGAQAVRVKKLVAGNLAGVPAEIARAKARAGLPPTAVVRSCYEAGRDGFWLHRWLETHGVRNVVVDSSSIEVSRRARQAKTDRLDATKLVRQLQRWWAGERRVWSAVHVPTPEAEAARQVTREIAAVRTDRTRLRNRIFGLLATQGVRRPKLDAHFAERLATLIGVDSTPLGAAWQARLRREWEHLRAVETRLRALRTARTLAVAAGRDQVAQVARQLQRLAGIDEAAAILSAELFGTRTFHNGREVGALTGLVPVPYRSDQRVADQGISKAGRGELRRLAIELAWNWTRYQRGSALTRWFEHRFASAGGRARRIGIVAVARKLMIALWRWVDRGVIPDGAQLKAAAQ